MPAHADFFKPSITHVYFDKDGVPYYGIVHYTITCYGYTTDYRRIPLAPGSYTPEPVFRYSATCNGYGCPVYEQYYLQHSYFDWCDLEGVADNQNFIIRDIFPFSRCDDVEGRAIRDFGTYPRDDYIRKFYYATPEYESCIYFEDKKPYGDWMESGKWTVYTLNFSRIYDKPNHTEVLQLPGRDLLYGNLPYQYIHINRSDIPMSLEGYIAYLETCTVNTDPACPGWIIEGKPLKSFPEYRSLKKNATYLKDHPCDTFLVDTDPSLIMPFTDYLGWGSCDGPCNLTEQICEARFTIPSESSSGNARVRTTSVTPTSKKVSPESSITNQKNISVKTTSITSTSKTLPAIPSTTSRDNTSITIPSVTPTHGGSITVHRSPVESLFCSILSWLDMSCENV
jgi:hypothetical protein